jgi:hypothetical protein
MAIIVPIQSSGNKKRKATPQEQKRKARPFNVVSATTWLVYRHSTWIQDWT